MKEKIKRIPLPLCGVMLSLATLGNLLQSYSEILRYTCGIIAGLLLVLILMKFICYPQLLIEDLNNPIMASVAGTFPMALMLLSVYTKPWFGKAAYYIWLLAILLHLILVIYFTIKFIFHLDMKKVFSSYFIVYVGITVAAITASAYDQTAIGTIAFWFGLLTLIPLLILITTRYIKYREVPEPAKPLICIYAAPTSLSVAGYIQSVTPKSTGLLLVMYVAAFILYIFALIKLWGCLKLPFYPSYAAFTFPFVISAVASKQTLAYLTKIDMSIPGLEYIVLLETIIAVALVGYTFIRFMIFIFFEKKQQDKTQPT